MSEEVLNFDRDGDIIKEKCLNFLAEEERDAFLTRMVKLAVYN
mgnify:CR=1 FL=1